MVHIGTAVLVHPMRGVTSFGDRTIPPAQSVLIVRDDDKNSELLDSVCDFLDVGVEHAGSCDDLLALLRGLRPIAVITDLEGDVQDGFHVLKVIAGYDRDLPVMLLSGNNQAFLGAVEGVREVWNLSRVTTATDPDCIGTLVDFICHAARDAGMRRLMRV